MTPDSRSKKASSCDDQMRTSDDNIFAVVNVYNIAASFMGSSIPSGNSCNARGRHH
jgi:hypothetical protein